MTLQILCPYGRERERDYVFSVIFSDWMDIPWCRVSQAREDISIQMPGRSGEIRLPDTFFSQGDQCWLTPELLPTGELDYWDCADLEVFHGLEFASLPIIFGQADTKYPDDASSIILPIDLFGASFFMLSGYDEVVSSNRDGHDRFPGVDSIAYKCGFLEYPVVDQYSEVLWRLMKRLWPALERRSRTGQVVVTCDVDVPLDPRANSLTKLLRGLAVHAAGRGGLDAGLSLIRNYIARRRGKLDYDPYYTFDWYMSECEKYGHCATFYFIPDNTAGAIDGYYGIRDELIESLIRRMHLRGHEIGTHGSYNTYRSEAQIKRERDRIGGALKAVDAGLEAWGNRQHYLRWDAKVTPDYLQAAGYRYDSTGSYADRPGFRYGTARPFRMWSWQRHESLELVQRPLICMESSVIADRYMGLGYSQEALLLMQNLKQRALSHGGDFTLLWHNSHLTTEQDRQFFSSLLR